MECSSFQDIWEKEEPWPEGKDVIKRICNSLIGKSLKVDRVGPSEIDIIVNIPFDKDIIEMIPYRLTDIFLDRCSLIRDYYDENILLRLTEDYKNHRITDSLIAKVNQKLNDYEFNKMINGEDTLDVVVGKFLGLEDHRAIKHLKFEIKISDNYSES